MKKLKKFIIYSIIAVLTLIVRLAIKLIPFKKLMPKVTNCDNVEEFELTTLQKNRLRYLLNALESTRQRVPWRVQCFESSIVCLLFARILKINMNVYFGINKTDGRIHAHAWTKVGEFLISGGESAHLFTIVYQRGYKCNVFK